MHPGWPRCAHPRERSPRRRAGVVGVAAELRVVRVTSDADECVLGQRTGRPCLALLGESHAARTPATAVVRVAQCAQDIGVAALPINFAYASHVSLIAQIALVGGGVRT